VNEDTKKGASHFFKIEISVNNEVEMIGNNKEENE